MSIEVGRVRDFAGTARASAVHSDSIQETAWWIPYVHLENVQSRLLNGRPSPFLMRIYAFEMSARAGTGVLAGLETWCFDVRKFVY
jgi:hypothetical protein